MVVVVEMLYGATGVGKRSSRVVGREVVGVEKKNGASKSIVTSVEGDVVGCSDDHYTYLPSQIVSEGM